MIRLTSLAVVMGLLSGAAHAAEPILAKQTVPVPPALLLDGVPTIPASIVASTARYSESRGASFQDWTADGGMLITTRFGNVAQLHKVAAPGAARTQITFGAEPVAGAGVSPGGGDATILVQDTGGGEFFQFFRLEADGSLALITDGKSRNTSPVWSRNGKAIAFASTRRNGADNDIYLMNPRNPSAIGLVQQVSGGGWSPADFSPDGKTLAVINRRSINDSSVHLVDLENGQMRALTRAPQRGTVSFDNVQYGPDGRIFLTTDRDHEFQYLATIDPRTGVLAPLGPKAKWDVDAIDVSPDGKRIAVLKNEAGLGVLHIVDAATGAIERTPTLPPGVIGGIEFSDDGTRLGLTLGSARSPGDAYSIDVATGAVTRWTFSELGGLVADQLVEPELITLKSFDGLEVSGFLYRPNPEKFPGARPTIIDIHGGPEAQTRPGFQGRKNYLINELGIAIFYPNVRGSSGYGKTFLTLDNGFKREDSVKDIGAFLDFIRDDPLLDEAKVGVTGGSYGGYMTLAVMIHFGDRITAGYESVGITNFVTFLTNTQDYRRDLRRVEYGDERDPKMREFLIRISPLTNVAKIRDPLLVLTGLNDPRVPASEADQMIAAVRAQGGTAWHVLGRDEGHGFRRKANVDTAFWTSVLFWRTHLLGQ